MSEFFAALVSGVLQGALYGAIAIGLSLLFGVMKVLNFTHGSLLMLGMFVAYGATQLTGLDPYVSIVVVIPVMFAFGYLLQTTMITPLYRRERSFVIEPTSVLILTAGLWLILDNGMLLAVGSQYRTVETSLTDISFSIGSLVVTLPRLIAALGAVLFTLLLSWLLRSTDAGRAMRATAQNRESAALAGINVYRTYAKTFGVSAALTGAAGALLLPFFYVYPSVGFVFDIRAFLIVTLGGLGSIWGTFAGGLIMGIVESVALIYTGAEYAQAIFFVFFIVILVVRPQGLFGKPELA